LAFGRQQSLALHQLHGEETDAIRFFDRRDHAAQLRVSPQPTTSGREAVLKRRM
jgi:hypothetical protein